MFTMLSCAISTHVSYFLKCLFKLFALLKLQISFYYWVVCSLCILDTCFLSDISFTHIFYQTGLFSSSFFLNSKHLFITVFEAWEVQDEGVSMVPLLVKAIFLIYTGPFSCCISTRWRVERRSKLSHLFL